MTGAECLRLLDALLVINQWRLDRLNEPRNSTCAQLPFPSQANVGRPSVTSVEADHLPNTQERVLRAKSSSNPHQLGGAISMALMNDGKVTVRAVGASAVNQAVKAAVISRGHMALQGHDVVMAPGMENTQGNPRPGTSGGNELTCVVLRIWTVLR